MIKLLILSAVLQELLLYPANTECKEMSCETPNRAPGTCIDLKECVPLLIMFQQVPVPMEDVIFMRKSLCGFENKDPLVCCPSDNGSTPPSTQSPPVTNSRNTDPSEDVMRNESVQYDPFSNPLLPTDCGKDFSERIIDGGIADIDEFPWIALLQYSNGIERSFLCEGVLISKRYVLTAANCVYKNTPKNMRLKNVLLGEYDTSTDVDCIRDKDTNIVCSDNPIMVDIEERIVHENYHPRSKFLGNNIALLRLSRDIMFTDYVKPICLPSNTVIGEGLYASGWSKTNLWLPHRKLKVSLSLADWNVCQLAYATKTRLILSAGMFCAEGKKAQCICRGDSGGPLMYLRKDQNGTSIWSVVGVVSVGRSENEASDRPAVYTKVIDFMPWILSKLRP